MSPQAKKTPMTLAVISHMTIKMNNILLGVNWLQCLLEILRSQSRESCFSRSLARDPGSYFVWLARLAPLSGWRDSSLYIGSLKYIMQSVH